MEKVHPVERLFGAAKNAWRVRWLFGIVSFVVLFLTFSLLLALDLVPDAPTSAEVSLTPLISGTAPLSPNVIDAFATGELPVKIDIPSIKLSVKVSNPASTDIETLDGYLLKGAVRYPTSGLLGENGNVILFGHSSYLPIVSNQAFKTFDGIQNLKAGDEITVSSSDHAYVYVVEQVGKMSAASDAAIPLNVSGKMLTLSTCNSFGEKTDRFVVTATFKEVRAL